MLRLIDGTPGNLGNANLLGEIGGGLDGFEIRKSPAVTEVYGNSYQATITNPPGDNNWQLNLLYTGIEGNGAVISDVGRDILRLTFHINDDRKAGIIRLTEIDQTFKDDNITPVAVQIDTTTQSLDLGLVGTEQQTLLPLSFALTQNHPNPFNMTTTFEYDLPQQAHVKMDIFNSRGQKVKVIDEGEKNPGSYRIAWDGTSAEGRDLPTGIYILRFRAAQFHAIRKMMLIK